MKIPFQIKLPKLTHGLILLFFAWIIFPSQSVQPIAGLGIEASWHQALAMALKNEFTFGTDFIFNYGPLGFLDDGFLPEVVHVGARFLFDMYLVANLVFVVHYALGKAKAQWLVIVCILLMFLPWGYIGNATFTLLFLFLFNLFHANENHRSFSLYNAVFIAALMFFVKLNFSLVISLLLYATLIYLFVTQRFSWRELLAVVITHLFLIYWGAYQLHVNIGQYLISSWYIIRQYDEAQARVFLNQQNFYIVIVAAVAVTVFAIVAFFRNVQNVYQRHDYLFTFLMVFSAMYLSLKQQFTSLSIDSAMAYFIFLPSLFGLLWIFLRDSGHWFSRLTVATLIISILTFQYLRYAQSGNVKQYLSGFFPREQTYFYAKYGTQNKSKEPILDLLTVLKLHSPYNYFKSLIHKKPTYILPEYNHKNRLLPSSILQKIGDHTVDILPNEVSYVFYNNLNYNPRPSIQSRQTAGYYLDKLNETKYFSKTAPQFILSQWQPDGLVNPLWQETFTKLAIMCNYEKITAASVPQFNSKNQIINYDTLSVYKHKIETQNYKLNLIRKVNLKFEEQLALDTTKQLILVKAYFEPTLQGNIAKLFFQNPYLFADYTDLKHKLKNYKVSMPLFESGVIINKKIENNADLDNLFQYKGQKNESYKSVAFHSKSHWSYKNNIVIEFYRIDFPRKE